MRNVLFTRNVFGKPNKNILATVTYANETVVHGTVSYFGGMPVPFTAAHAHGEFNAHRSVRFNFADWIEVATPCNDVDQTTK